MADEDVLVVVVKETSVVSIPSDQIVSVVVAEPTVLTVEQQTAVVLEVEKISVVAVGAQGPEGIQGDTGPEGPIGPQGESGPAGVSYDFSQASASDYWLINHNLGFRPTVGVFDSAGVEVEAEVQHLNANQVAVSFSTPLAGIARLV